MFMTCAAGYDIVDYDQRQVPQKIAMNVMLSGSGAGIMHQLIDFGQTAEHQRMRVFDPQDLMTSVLAGLVASSAACNNVESLSSLIIGCVASILMALFDKILKKHEIDDPLRVFQIFGVSGFWGCLAVGFFDNDTGLVFTGAFEQIELQALGAIFVAGWTMAFSSIFFHVFR